jgi:hypothetical protein
LELAAYQFVTSNKLFVHCLAQLSWNHCLRADSGVTVLAPYALPPVLDALQRKFTAFFQAHPFPADVGPTSLPLSLCLLFVR